MATIIDPLTGLPESNTQDAKTGVISYDYSGTNPVITPQSMTTPPAITPGTYPTYDPSTHAATTSSIYDQIQNDYKTANDKYNAALGTQTATGNSITSLMGSLFGKTADTAAANEANGVNSANADIAKYGQTLADLNGQISSLKNEASAIPIQTQQNNVGTGATDTGVAPQTAGALRENALKALSIGQQADIASAALTGSQIRLQAAKDKVQQIIDLKYQPIEAELNMRQEQYNLNKDTLSALDKDRTEKLGIELDKEKAALDQKKNDEKTMQDLLLKARVGGAPADLTAHVQDLIQKGTTNPQEVTNLIGSYTANLPASAQEYQFAKNQGYTGTYEQYQNEDANRKARAVGTTGTGTLQERQSQSVSKFSNAFVAGAKLPDGTPVLDANGFITPTAWRAAIADAPAEGLTRAEFIREFGHLLYGDKNGIARSYGITPAEAKLIGVQQ